MTPRVYAGLLIGCALIASNAEADLSGRLFFTPQERQQLDAQRAGKVVVPEQPGVAPNTLRLDGVVLRSRGPATSWWNGKPLEPGAPVGNLSVHPNPQGQPGAVLHDPKTGARHRVLPGQRYDTTSGIVSETLPSLMPHPTPIGKPLPDTRDHSRKP